MIPPELALVAGIALSCMMFAVYRGSTALIWSFLIGYLVLPVGATADLPGMPAMDKNGVIWVGAALGTLLFQPHALQQLRWHAADLLAPMILLSTFYTSVVNGLGSWDGIGMAINTGLILVLPYGLARVHLRRPADVVSLGTALFWGALVCVPLAIWEFRMSPQLHTTLYGYFPHTFAQQVRWGHYRPVLFMGHGLAVASYFGTCLLIGLVLHKRGVLRLRLNQYAGIAIAALGLGLAITMSIGPWCATLLTWGLFYAARRWRWTPFAAAVPGVLWITVMFSTEANMAWMVEPFASIGATDRAASLEYRLNAMEQYSTKIREQPWWGHGGWRRGRIENLAIDSDALNYMLLYGVIGAGLRYLWLFWMLWACIRAAERAAGLTDYDLILLLACLLGLSITTSILGTASVFMPAPLVGGAVTGLVALSIAGQRRRIVSQRASAIARPSVPMIGPRTLLSVHPAPSATATKPVCRHESGGGMRRDRSPQSSGESDDMESTSHDA